jgi:excisionase family DNA binding protein
MTKGIPVVFTPKTLAQRWEVSPGAIYNMIERGELGHFRAGRTIRIPARVVEEIECGSQDTEGSGRSPETTAEQLADGQPDSTPPLRTVRLPSGRYRTFSTR